jgi:hypothetical protein
MVHSASSNLVLNSTAEAVKSQSSLLVYITRLPKYSKKRSVVNVVTKENGYPNAVRTARDPQRLR